MSGEYDQREAAFSAEEEKLRKAITAVMQGSINISSISAEAALLDTLVKQGLTLTIESMHNRNSTYIQVSVGRRSATTGARIET